MREKLYEQILKNMAKQVLGSSAPAASVQLAIGFGGDVISRGTMYASNAAARIKWMQLPKNIRDRCPAPGTPGGDECVRRMLNESYSKLLEKLNDKKSKCKKTNECEKIDKIIHEVTTKINMIGKSTTENTDVSVLDKVINEQALKMVGSLAFQVVGWGVLQAVYDKAIAVAETMWSEAARKCASQKGAFRELCINRQRLMALQKKRSALSSIYNQCASKAGSNNGKCIKFKNELGKVTSQIQVYQDNVDAYQRGAAMSVSSQLQG